MRIDKKTIRDVKQFRSDKFDEAVDFLKKRSLSKVKESLEWVEFASKIIDLAKTPIKQRLWGIVIGIVCILIMGLLSIRMPKSQITFEVVTGNVSLTLKKELEIENMLKVATQIDVNNLDKVDINGFNVHYEGDTDEWIREMELEGQIAIDTLFIDANATIELEQKNGDTGLYVKNSILGGTLSTKNAFFRLETKKTSIEKHISPKIIPENISFRCVQTGKEPTYFQFFHRENWQLRNIQVKGEMSFEEEYPLRSGKFVSRIQSGEIIIRENGRIHTFREGERLVLRDVSTRRLEISDTDNSSIKISFEGSVGKILAGLRGFEENLKPTWLEYFYFNKRIKFFWGAFVFLLGLLFSIKNALFK